MIEDFQVFRNLNILEYFSAEEQNLIIQEIEIKELEKDEVLLKERTVCSHIWLVVSGSFYQYRSTTNCRDDIFDLHIDGDFVLNHQSFISRKPSTYTIKAFEKSMVYQLSVDSIYKLTGISQSFLKLGRLLEDKTSRARIGEMFQKPNKKYSYILHERPELLQKFPQTMIASYLQITPETLSRVRKRIFSLLKK
ncbi:MAG: Crp/Fnr family transcriptional regulator [Winogradskyella sp.]